VSPGERSVAVEVAFAADGRPTVRRFRWQDQDIPVTATGRSWVDDAGRHVLVMGPDRRTYELVLSREDLLWYVERAAPQRAVV
jgi:hypothetical protein